MLTLIGLWGIVRRESHDPRICEIAKSEFPIEKGGHKGVAVVEELPTRKLKGILFLWAKVLEKVLVIVIVLQGVGKGERRQ